MNVLNPVNSEPNRQMHSRTLYPDGYGRAQNLLQGAGVQELNCEAWEL